MTENMKSVDIGLKKGEIILREKLKLIEILFQLCMQLRKNWNISMEMLEKPDERKSTMKTDCLKMFNVQPKPTELN